MFIELLGWEQDDLADPAPDHQIGLPELEVTLEPTWQVRDREDAAQLLIRRLLGSQIVQAYTVVPKETHQSEEGGGRGLSLFHR